MTKRIFRIFLATLLVAALSLSMLAGCGASKDNTSNGTPADSSNSNADQNKKDEKITLRVAWWGNQVRNDGTVKALELYSQQNPNITFEPEFSDWNGYWDKMAVQAASGTLADIIQHDYGYIKQYQAKGQIISLDKYLENNTIDVSNVADSVLDSGRIDGQLYALVAGMNCKALLYNKDVLDAAGVTMPEQPTWDELFEISQTVYQKTGKQFIIPSNDEQTMLFLARAKGEKFFADEGGKLGMSDSSTALRFYTMLNDTLKTGAHVAPEIMAEASTNQMSLFAAETIWCELTNSNMIVSILDQCKEGTNYGIAMFPTEKDAVQQPLFIKPSMFWCITSNSEYQDEAAKVLDFLTNSVDANNILLGERGVPISSVVSDAIKPKLDSVTADVTEYVERVAQVAAPIDAPDPAGAGEVKRLVSELADEVRYGVITPEEAAERFFNEANEILAQFAE